MKIVRVLNTNAVVNIDQEGRELIITGAGIGFKKKKGENLDEALADKTYYLESVDDSRRLQEVVKEISEEYLEIASRVVKTAREEGLKVRDSLYVTLTDHINSAVDRYRENIACFGNFSFWTVHVDTFSLCTGLSCFYRHRDHIFKYLDLASVGCMYSRCNIPCVIGSEIYHSQENALNRQFPVQSFLYCKNGLDQLLKSFNRQICGLHRYQHGIGRDQCIDRCQCDT